MKVAADRECLTGAQRVVVKVGTRVLVNRRGRPDPDRLRALATQIGELLDANREVVLVTSGAIGAGVEALNLKRRPCDLPGLQMAAAVGQTQLLSRYAQLFAKQGRPVGQVLLTHEDLKHRERHLNARNTMMALLRSGVVPIVNENDVVAIDEIRFGDNDRLAALVAILVDADALVLLTTADGVRAPAAGGRTKRQSWIGAIDDEVYSWVWQERAALATGGMQSKLQAAEVALEGHIPVAIVDGRKTDALRRLLAGADVGTLIDVSNRRARALLPSKKRWIAFFHRAQGALHVDDGAVAALRDGKRSLLPVGIRQVEGHFPRGALVQVKDRHGRAVARGLVGYPSADILAIKGLPSQQIEARLGYRNSDAVIHRDNIVVL